METLQHDMTEIVEVGAREKLDAGASLVQVYTGLVYRGPACALAILATGGAGPVADADGRGAVADGGSD